MPGTQLVSPGPIPGPIHCEDFMLKKESTHFLSGCHEKQSVGQAMTPVYCDRSHVLYPAGKWSHLVEGSNIKSH